MHRTVCLTFSDCLLLKIFNYFWSSVYVHVHWSYIEVIIAQNDEHLKIQNGQSVLGLTDTNRVFLGFSILELIADMIFVWFCLIFRKQVTIFSSINSTFHSLCMFAGIFLELNCLVNFSLTFLGMANTFIHWFFFSNGKMSQTSTYFGRMFC